MAAAAEQIKPPQVEVTDVDLKKSYVAGGGGYLNFSRSLPAANDDLSQCIGLRTYEQMRTDPDVEAAILLYKILVLSEPLQIQSCVAKPEMEGYEQATEYAGFLKRSVAGLSTPIKNVFYEMLDAIPLGNKIAEVTCKDGTGVDRSKLLLDSIKPKPYTAISFVVDLFWNVLGFLASWNLTRDNRQILPREKFFVLTLQSQNCDPRGRSGLRAAWRAWDFKEHLYDLYFKWLRRFAIPSLVGKTAKGQKQEVRTNTDGTTTTLTPEQAMLAGLVAFENGTVVVIPPEAEVTALEAKGTGEQFERGFNIAGTQITKAILLQELATRDAQHQTKGAGESQMDIVDGNVSWLKSALVEAFVSDVVKPHLIANFGEAALDYMPLVSLGDTERKDWATDATAAVALIAATRVDENGQTVSVLTFSQVQSILMQLGLPAPTEEEMQAIRAQAESAQSKQNPDNAQSGDGQDVGSNQQKLARLRRAA